MADSIIALNSRSHRRKTSTKEEKNALISWESMRARCLNTRHEQYKDYGGRGIKICDRWKLFDNFLSDMGPREKSLSLDRRDNNGNYEPSNCRWATQIEQKNNTSIVRRYAFQGLTHTVTEWAEILGIPRRRLEDRFRKEKSPRFRIEKALKEFHHFLPPING